MARCEADHSSPCTAMVKSTCSHISTNPICYMTWCLVKKRDNCTFICRLLYLLYKALTIQTAITNIPYILESNPHPFCSFTGLKNQMWIRIACELDSQSRAGFWKNDRAAVRAVKQYNNLLFYLLLIILYII
jgi:hypothetical protein